MPAGRPTSYEERFCEMLIDHMAKGYSFESFASVTDTCKDTLYEWVKVYPKFSDAKKRATEKSRYWWESQGIDNILNKKEMTKDQDGNTTLIETSLNAAAWIFNMKNRFKDEWRDKQEIETTPTNLTVTISGPVPPDEKS